MKGKAKHKLAKLYAASQQQSLAKTDLEKEVVADGQEHGDLPGYLLEVCEHGCQSGVVSQLVSYHQTTLFYANHKDDIWELLNAAASETDNILTFLSQMASADSVATEAGLHNMLAWWAYEHAASILIWRMKEKS